MATNNSYVIQVVEELKDGGLLYPKNIPADRGNTALILQIIIVIVLWAACVYFASGNHGYEKSNLIQSVKFSWWCTTTNTLLLIICCLVWRICNLCEELQHVNSRYNGNTGKIFESALQMNTISIITTVLCLASFIGMVVEVRKPLTYLWTFGPEAYMLSLISSLLITRLINIDASRLDTSLTLSQFKGLDYGSGMAYSYFYGYLNIILPARGDESKGLIENINVYEAKHGVNIPVKKLFILIPTSLRIPPDLEEASYNWLKSVAVLESVVKTRAGTKNRSYHNTVYKLYPAGRDQQMDSMFVITEGATPLLTFYEVLQHSGKDSTSYNDFQKDIAGSFYRTLRHIIKSKPEVRDLCELIFYEDVDSKQTKVNVGKILFAKIKEQSASPYDT